MQQPGSITFGTPLAPSSGTFGGGSLGTFGGFGGSGMNQPPAFGSTNTGLKFGTTPTTSSNLFGGGGLTAPTNTTGGLNFGTPATGTNTATSTGFSFGSNTTQPTGGLNFGATTATTTTTGFSFGTTTSTTAPNTGLNFGSFNKPVSTTQPLSFGSTNTFTAPSLTSGTTGSSLFSGGGGLFGAKQITTTTTLTGLNPIVSQQQQQPTQGQIAAQPINVGLGGVDTFQNKSGTIGGATTKESDGKLTKEQQLPNEFLQLIDGFKNHIKQQKMYSSDVARGTIKPLRKIQEDIDQLRTQLAELGNSIGIVNRQQAEKLKYETAKCLSHAEMAQRIHDTPPGFQIDNTTPLQYFIETVHKFENDLSAIRQQIEATEKHIKSLERPKALSSQEMTLGLRRLHETFVALAGRLQSLHSQVEMQKTQYLNMRKYLFKDTMNVLFDQNHFTNKLNTTLGACTGSINTLLNRVNNNNVNGIGSFTPPKRAAGPTPFSTLGKNTLSFISTSQQHSNNNDVSSGAGGGGASAGGAGGNTNATTSNINSNQTTVPPPAYPSGSTTLTNWGSGGIKTTQPPSYNASIGLTTNSLLFGSPTGTGGSPSNDFQLQKPPTGNKRGKH